MNLNLENKNIVITGGSKGLGYELVKELLKEGCNVSFNCRNKLEAKKVNNLNNISNKWHYNICDVTREDDIQNYIDDCKIFFKSGIDILINNVGGLKNSGTFFELKYEHWKEAWDLNFMSTVNMIKYSYPIIKKDNNSKIINISSITAIQPGDYNPHYSASKLALLSLNKHLSNSMASESILVNTFILGNFKGDLFTNYVKEKAKGSSSSFEVVKKEQEELVKKGIPLKRLGEINEIVPHILIAISPRSGWMTGSSISIDGGKLKTIL
jgi:3-oxoacyl-[acyl-carrier protein] reductase